jgi:hypothetical protein
MQQQLFSKRNGRGWASARRLPLSRPPMSASGRSGEELIDPWYVTSSRGRFTEMRVAKKRSEAIALAWTCCARALTSPVSDPMLETGQQRIDAVTIRRICWEGAQHEAIVEVVSVRS